MQRNTFRYIWRKMLTKSRQMGARLFIKYVYFHVLDQLTSRWRSDSIKPLDPVSLPTPMDMSTNIPIINESISVIIPTLNGGMKLRLLLRQLAMQRGISNLEIIVIDSGSNDGSMACAAEAGAKVLTIAPEHFNHGEARNIAASKASGDYLIFLVQDVSLVTDLWMFKTVSSLKHSDNVALTMRQIPRFDADIFSAWLNRNHHVQLHLVKDQLLFDGISSIDSLMGNAKRRALALDDVAMAIKADIFHDFKYLPKPFGEDIDLAYRLAKAHRKYGYLHSNPVIHSHNRRAAYWFQRGVAEGFLHGAFEPLNLHAKDPYQVVLETRLVLSHLAWSLEQHKTGVVFNYNPEDLFRGDMTGTYSKTSLFVTEQLEDIFISFPKGESSPYEGIRNLLVSRVADMLPDLSLYVSQRELVSWHETSEAIIRAASLAVGSELGKALAPSKANPSGDLGLRNILADRI